MKIWYRHTIEFYSAVKTNVIMFSVKWTKLQIIMSRTAQAQKDKCCTLSFTCWPQFHIFRFGYFHSQKVKGDRREENSKSSSDKDTRTDLLLKGGWENRARAFNWGEGWERNIMGWESGEINNTKGTWEIIGQSVVLYLLKNTWLIFVMG